MKNNFAWLVLIFTALACNLTIPAATPIVESSPEITPTVQIDLSVTTPPLNAIIPPTLASGASTAVTTEVEFPYINPSVGEMPAHSKYTLENYLLVTSLHQPYVLVFKASEYAGYSELTRGIVSALQTLDLSAGAPLPEPLKTGVFTAQVQPIAFQNGRGLRYLTQSGQAPAPANNYELFYYFQGLTTDGEYYLSAILPTSAPFLVADENPASPLPVDGIPFDYNNFDTLPQYFAAIAQKLNGASPETFAPSLTLLDTFVQSFLIQP